MSRATAAAPRAGECVAIVVAAGSSRRMGGRNKILAPLLGRPVLRWTVEALAGSGIRRIVVVTSAAWRAEIVRRVADEGWPAIAGVCLGGERRQDSVRQGLRSAGNAPLVLVHDGARPLVTAGVIQRGLRLAGERGAAVAAVPVKDTVKRAGPDGRVIETPARSEVWAVQTPQIFRADLLRRAHLLVTDDVTDDAAMVEAIGAPVYLFQGSYENLKVTTPEDLIVAEALLRARSLSEV